MTPADRPPVATTPRAGSGPAQPVLAAPAAEVLLCASDGHLHAGGPGVQEEEEGAGNGGAQTIEEEAAAGWGRGGGLLEVEGGVGTVGDSPKRCRAERWVPMKVKSNPRGAWTTAQGGGGDTPGAQEQPAGTVKSASPVGSQPSPSTGRHRPPLC